MGGRTPVAVRWGSALLVTYAVLAGVMGSVALACWWRVGALADAYGSDLLPADLERAVHSLRLELGFSVVAGIGTGLGAAALSHPIRRMWRRSRMAVWWFLG